MSNSITAKEAESYTVKSVSVFERIPYKYTATLVSPTCPPLVLALTFFVKPITKQVYSKGEVYENASTGSVDKEAIAKLAEKVEAFALESGTVDPSKLDRSRT